MEPRQEYVPVTMPDGGKLRVEATILGGEEDVAFKIFSFQDVTETITSIASTITRAIQEVKPKKAAVEFGLEIAVAEGKLTGLLAKGSGKANLKISLEWSE
jgi:hypothetical protein